MAVPGCARDVRLLQADLVAVPHIRAQGCVFGAKRLIGRKLADPILQSDARLWPFKEIPGAVTQVQVVEEEKKFASREVSSVILTRMKETAEASARNAQDVSRWDVLTDTYVEFESAVEVRKFRCFARW